MTARAGRHLLARRTCLRNVAAVVIGSASGGGFLAACGQVPAAAVSSSQAKVVHHKRTGSALVPLRFRSEANLVANHAPGPVSIQGHIDRTWAKARVYTLSATDQRVKSVGNIVGSTRALRYSKCYLLWDRTSLYVAEHRVQTPFGLPVVDPKLGTSMIVGDALGIFVATDHFTVQNYSTSGHYSVWATPRGPKGDHRPHMWFRFGSKGKQINKYPRWPVASRVTASGYVLTMAIPWAALQVIPWKVTKGARTAFTIAVSTTGSKGTGWGMLMLIGSSSLPSRWGTLTLA